MKTLITLSVFLAGIVQAQALVISEIMSNPMGDDSGREWVEIFNDTAEDIDLSAMTVSIKGGSFVSITPLQGGMMLPGGGYAIIGSTVSGATRFLLDYPAYAGPLFRASMSLVNTGTTSIDIKLNGVVAASLPAYAAAKEGATLSYIAGGYVAGAPTPGASNQAMEPVAGTNATTTETQATLPQMSPPSPDIVIYMPEEKIAIAGAETEFSVFSMNRAGKPLTDLQYIWAFGDGGQGVGSTTRYRYVYNGRYIAQVEATSQTVAGKGRMMVRVVPPDIAIVSFGSGKYGSYIEINNPNPYDLDLSQWALTIDGASFPFPRNTLLPANSTTRFSGLAMGFASTTLATSTAIKILFPNLEEVTRFLPTQTENIVPLIKTVAVQIPAKTYARMPPKVLGVVTSTKAESTSASTSRTQSKDKRIAAWIRSLFK